MKTFFALFAFSSLLLLSITITARKEPEYVKTVIENEPIPEVLQGVVEFVAKSGNGGRFDKDISVDPSGGEYINDRNAEANSKDDIGEHIDFSVDPLAKNGPAFHGYLNNKNAEADSKTNNGEHRDFSVDPSGNALAYVNNGEHRDFSVDPSGNIFVYTNNGEHRDFSVDPSGNAFAYVNNGEQRDFSIDPSGNSLLWSSSKKNEEADSKTYNGEHKEFSVDRPSRNIFLYLGKKIVEFNSKTVAEQVAKAISADTSSVTFMLYHHNDNIAESNSKASTGKAVAE